MYARVCVIYIFIFCLYLCRMLNEKGEEVMVVDCVGDDESDDGDVGEGKSQLFLIVVVKIQVFVVAFVDDGMNWEDY